MRLWNQLAQDRRLIFILSGLCGLFFLIIVGLVVDLYHIPTRFSFHIPPDLSNGATLKAGEIPNAYVGQFAFTVWQVINNWSNNGAVDAPKNLALYEPYLTPPFLYALKTHYQHLLTRGTLQNRVQVMQPISGENPTVTKFEDGSWQVILKLRDSEYVNGILIKDKDIEYPLKVVRFNGNTQLNPFGLALAGFTATPFVLKVLK